MKMLMNGRADVWQYCPCCSPKGDRRKQKHQAKRKEKRQWKKDYDIG